MRKSRFILLVFILVGLPFAVAAKTKTFTKKYKNERLEVVLKDLCKRNGYTLNVVDDIDLDKRITFTFKGARTNTVLKKVLDADCQGKVKKGVLTVSRKPVPPTVYVVKGTVPVEEVDNDSINEKTFLDTTYTINCRTVTVSEQVKKEEEPAKQQEGGSRIQVLLGGGYGSMGYELGQAGQVKGDWAANVQLRYLYYFTPNWGVGLGVGLSNYQSTGVLNMTLQYNQDKDGQPLMDSEGERYTHVVRTNDWTEKQQAYMMDVPVLVQCIYPVGAEKKLGATKLYADLGANLGFCFSANRQLKSGSIDHMGSYQPWHLDLQHIDDHDFYTEQAESFSTDRYQLDLKLPAVGLMADLGVAIPVSAHVDVMIGAYANYTVNNVCASTHDLGWKQNLYTGAKAYRNHEFMEYYQGLIGSQFAQAVHPWQAGVRVGVNIKAGGKKNKEVEPEMVYRREQVCDTTITVANRIETIVKSQPVVVEKIQRVLEKSVIWFDVNSSEPKLQPADILDQIAAILKDNPTQTIMITGHASKEGNKATNQRLSEQRAQVIAYRLIQLGVRPEQIKSQGLGVAVDYVAGNHDISLDRRVEITPITE